MSVKHSAPLFYTKAELSRHFQLPESTIRFYCNRFAAWLSGEGEGRKRRYAPSCLEVLTFIRENQPQARTSATMEKLLNERFPRQQGVSTTRAPAPAWPDATIPSRFNLYLPPDNHDAANLPPVSATALGLLEKQSEALQRIAASLDILVAKMSGAPCVPSGETALPQGTVSTNVSPASIPPDVEALREEVNDLRLLLGSAEKTQQEDLEQLRALIFRLAKKNGG